MSIPKQCTVLVVGGGPAGSYTASALAREGIDVVLLEADHFPRYHIGESMLPSFRNYLRFIDLDSKFDEFGFTQKRGAAFKLRQNHKEAYTDFIDAGGPNNYAWNVIRSESDELMLRHAAQSGAQVFEGVKIDSVEFTSLDESSKGTGDLNGGHHSEPPSVNPGRPVSASYTCKDDGLKGTIQFDYIVDASGRAGILSTKYLKNRSYNPMLKNVAIWGYFKGTGVYSPGTHRAVAPFFEALQDESGWAWFIPLHNGTTSVGIVQNQELAKTAKTAAANSREYYQTALKLAPNLSELIGEGELVSELRSASDYSYSASSYSFPYARIVGDAGCFIDPFFSSGVHLALMGGLSAATTLAASIRGDCTEHAAGQWHSDKVKEGYTRFLLAVLSTYQQMLRQTEYVLSDFGEDNFDKAFDFFKPIIQGTADATSKLTQAEFSRTINFFNQAFPFHGADEDAEGEKPAVMPSKEDQEALDRLRKFYSRDASNVDNFTTDVIDGRVPRLERGSLGLMVVQA